MSKRITFREMEHSDAMQEYINGQLSKIEEFLEDEPSPMHIDMVLMASKVREHPRAELRIKTPNYDLVTNYEHEGVDMYDVIDRVIDTMYSRLREAKKRRVDKNKTAGRHDDFKKQR